MLFALSRKQDFLTCKGIWTGALSPRGTLVQISSKVSSNLETLCPPTSKCHLGSQGITHPVSWKHCSMKGHQGCLTSKFLPASSLTIFVTSGKLINPTASVSSSIKMRIILLFITMWIECANVCSIITIWRNVAVSLQTACRPCFIFTSLVQR